MVWFRRAPLGFKSAFGEGGRVLRVWRVFAMGQGLEKCCEQRDDIPKEVVTHKFDENEKDVDEAQPTPVKAVQLGLFVQKRVRFEWFDRGSHG